jgi:hypothetical protein
MRRPFLVIIAFLPACGAGDARDEAFAVRDSAGVRIAESRLAAWTDETAWRLDSVPSLRIGAVDGPPEVVLFGVSAGRRLPDGGVVLGNNGIEVRRFDAQGAHLWTSGGKGAGPGDFQGISSIDVLAGDSLGVFDTNLARYSILAPDGRFARSVTLVGVRMGGGAGVGTLADGSVVARVVGDTPPRDATRRYRLSETLVVFDVRDGTPDTVGVFAGQERFVFVDGRGALHGPAAFPFAMTPAVRGAEVLVAHTERFEVLAFHASGALRRIVRRVMEPPAVTQGDVDEWRRLQLEGIRGAAGEMRGPAGDRRPRLIEAMTFPRTHAVLDLVKADAEGNLWVRHAPPPNVSGARVASRDWSVFDAQGRWLGVLVMPPNVNPMEIGADYLLGVAYDDLGVESVARYGLRKP